MKKWNYIVPFLILAATASPAIAQETTGAYAKEQAGRIAQKATGAHAMEQAGRKGDVDKIKELVNQGLSLESRGTLGYTPLMWVAMHGDAKGVKALLEMGADAKATAIEDGVDKGTGVLHAACTAKKDRLEKFRLLLAAGADPNATAKGGSEQSVWQHALNTSSSDEILQLLIDKGMDINAAVHEGYTPLWFAACKARPNVVTMLLKAGAKVRTVTADGRTPLTGAAMGSHIDQAEALRVINLLVASGADARAAAKNGSTPLHLAAGHAQSKESAQLLTALIAAGGDVNAADERGITPLFHVATVAQDSAPLHALLEAKANVDAVDKAGNGVWHHAVRRGGNAYVLQELSNTKADVNLKNKLGRTPLMIACSTYRTDIVEGLITDGAKVDLADNEGWTPLLIAAASQDRKLLTQWMSAEQELLTGKKPKVEDVAMYAEMMARGARFGQPERCLLLLRKGAKDTKTSDGTTLQTLLANREDEEAEAIRKLATLYLPAKPAAK
jgi:ankyrin repeat protein